jgi:hypothetical protein
MAVDMGGDGRKGLEGLNVPRHLTLDKTAWKSAVHVPKSLVSCSLPTILALYYRFIPIHFC